MDRYELVGQMVDSQLNTIKELEAKDTLSPWAEGYKDAMTTIRRFMDHMDQGQAQLDAMRAAMGLNKEEL